ncbi:MAG: phosphate ABC transporter permease subunit PstC, partial [Lentisphaerae bacterium]|nr:phosphate ABC transporter permease subunit PstC [Lentisphaerota bacterium]
MFEKRIIMDKFSEKLTLVLALFSCLVLVFMVWGLLKKSIPILEQKSLLDLLLTSSWKPLRGDFGFLPFIMGSLYVTSVAMVIAVPFSILTSIYLSEYAGRRIRNAAEPLIDLLAGIPSVVYGVWGILTVVPFVKHLAGLFGVFTTGYSVLSAGIVLAIMILPIIIHLSTEIFQSIPVELRNASLSLGATKWQTVKLVVVPRAMPGIIAAIVLGLSRAFGETMAVLMVAGNVSKTPVSVFDPAYPLPALIANNYGEMLSIPLYDSALLF